MNDQPLVDQKLVKYHFVAGMVYLMVALMAGFLFALQFLQHYPHSGVEWLSPGRIRMIHTNAVAYGFLLNCLLAGAYWAVPRLSGHPVWSRFVSWFLFWAIQAIVIFTVFGILFGPTLGYKWGIQHWLQAQAIEWGETPILIDPVVVVGLILIAINFMRPIIKGADKPLYVSLWYFSAGFIWTILNYVMGNYIPEFYTPGASGAAIAGLFIHDLVGLFVTPLGWGLMYYFVPVIMKRPIWSHAVSLIGFWGLAFFYPLNGVHHFLYSTIPMFAQYSAVVATVGVEVVVMTVFINFVATIRQQGGMLSTSLPIRWMFTGIVFYMITCMQCAYQVLLTTQQIIHFTDWVVGHAHLVMFGVFGFWILGMITELWPRLVDRPWHSRTLNTWHYWLSMIGTITMFIDLMAAGLVQGFSWRSLQPWEESVVASVPFWLFRSFAGTMIFVGQILFVYNMWRTARAPAPAAAAQPVTGLGAQPA
ncbi:MAG: cbb3-type cytochrome c oxidase subunit I [Verrucomicrobia bacterium]|nr:cbb3-type cytochrome c oxidase subunit I [Verrucomicrobiota bacterium]